MKKSLAHIKQVYFIGIGGIGMSALALWFKYHKYRVAGYDKIPSSITDQLLEKNITIHFQDNVNLIPTRYLSEKESTLIIYTPAIAKEHEELNFFIENNYWILKRAQVLGLITKEKFTIAVAGTHGKTTTSSMIAHILIEAGFNCTAFVGGIPRNFNTNLLVRESKNRQVVVIEADEYDRSFLKLNPDIAIIIAIEADHLDIYGNEQALKESFLAFSRQIKDDGQLIIQAEAAADLPKQPKKRLSIHHFGIGQGSYQSTQVSTHEDYFTFNFKNDSLQIESIKLYMPGFHNVENVTASITLAHLMGIKPDVIKNAVESYRGVKRRFEYIIKTKNLIYIDDYAHHPTEIFVLLTSIKKIYPNKNIMVIFQPHLFSRTRDFAKDFAKSLMIADKVFLMNIYPARELPIAGISSETIFKLIDKPQKYLIGDKELLGKIAKQNDIQVLVTIGAGDIDKYVPKLKILLENK